MKLVQYSDYSVSTVDIALAPVAAFTNMVKL